MPTTSVTPRTYTAKVSEAKLISTDIKEVKFTLDKPFSFTAGQYVWVEIPNLKFQDPKGTRRAFSICTTPNSENSILIIARLSQSGFKQGLFALTAGEPVIIHGPFGSLHFAEDPNIPIICVAGGVGIAPFLSLIPNSLTNVPARKIILVYASRADQEGPYTSIFREYQSKNPNFSLVEIKGSISKDPLTNLNSSFPSAKWMVIGPKGMVYSAAKTLYALGIKEENIVFEEFFITKNLTQSAILENKVQDLAGAFSLAMSQTSNHVILTDIDGYITFANKAAERITGYSFAEMQGQTPRLWGALESPEFYQKLWHTIKTERKPFTGEIQNRRKNGELYDAIVHISPYSDELGNLIGFMGTEEDITNIKEVDRMKTEFVSLASHQLRTPLTAIKWGLEAFMGNDTTNLNDKQKEELNDINSSTVRMIDLVNALLNVSRIESGRILINPVATNIVKLANDVVGRLKIEMAKKNIALVMNVADNLPEINVDQSLVGNVYQNLLTNAVSYSPEGSKIELSISEKDGYIISSVKDEGIGIPESEKAHIFEKFYRASNAKTVRPDGSGLGLYIVKSIVESSGGKLWFESVEGKGTTFYFSLPLSGMKAKEGEVSLS